MGAGAGSENDTLTTPYLETEPWSMTIAHVQHPK